MSDDLVAVRATDKRLQLRFRCVAVVAGSEKRAPRSAPVLSEKVEIVREHVYFGIGNVPEVESVNLTAAASFSKAVRNTTDTNKAQCAQCRATAQDFIVLWHQFCCVRGSDQERTAEKKELYLVEI